MFVEKVERVKQVIAIVAVGMVTKIVMNMKIKVIILMMEQ